MSNLPSWPGAATVYSRCMLINESLCARSYNAAKRKKEWRTPDDVLDTIEAMNKGDEETLKNWIAIHLDIVFPTTE